MGFKDVTEGDKIAKPIAIRYLPQEENPKNKSDAFEVCFEFEEPSTGNPERLFWQGWVSDAAIERTMDTLVNVLGFNMELAKSKGIEEKGVITDKDVKLVVEIEEYEGKSRPKIKWVNRIGGSAYVGGSVELVKTKLASPKMAAAFLAATQNA